jgi:hypothetical protein
MSATCTPFTPLAWQTVVDSHSNPAFIGQRKHTTWVRDQNRNFIDDEIERRFRPGDSVDVVVDLNRCLMPAEIERAVAGFGTVRHVGKLVTFVVLQGVRFVDLPRLAERPEVAMIEWRAPTYPEIDIASRAVQAHSSSAYAGLSAQDRNLTGQNVNIAIVDGGVDDRPASPFLSLTNVTFVAGFDATDPTDPGDGTRNPAQLTNLFHGSGMAAVALGRAAPGNMCRNPNDPAVQPNCAGIAPGAGLVDVKMYARDSMGNLVSNPEAALDWIGTHAATFAIRVVDYSSARCGDDDGTSAFAQQANFLAALGVVFVAANGNAPGNCTPSTPAGGRITKAPGSASLAIAVNASDDGDSILRTNDAVFPEHFVGPRSDWNFMNPNFAALKPDVTAPHGHATAGAFGINIAGATPVNGTSAAAAVVSGAAALLLERFPAMSAESVKQALLTSADTTRNTAFSNTTGTWDSALGAGLLNVGAAIENAIANAANPRFFNCKTPSASGVGQLCELRDGKPVWFNDTDITATTAPQVGHQTTIKAHVINDENAPATFQVSFGVYQFGVGSNQFIHIGTKVVTLMPHTDQWVDMDWTPAAVNHQCIQVSIASGADKDYSDNLTQRNFQVLPSQYTMRVENPLFVPARLDLVATSHRAGWVCTLSERTFVLDPFTDCARDVTITFDPPVGAAPGQQADCDVAVYATPDGGKERRAIGGVRVRTFVPRPCTAWGQVVDALGRPVASATVRVARVGMKGESAATRETVVTTNREGVFRVTIASGALHVIRVDRGGVGRGSLTLRPGCGLDMPRLVLTRDRLTAGPQPYIMAAD